MRNLRLGVMSALGVMSLGVMSGHRQLELYRMFFLFPNFEHIFFEDVQISPRIHMLRTYFFAIHDYLLNLKLEHG